MIQSNNIPDLSPPKTSSGNPCSLALPKFDLSRTIVMLVEDLARQTIETDMQIDIAHRQLEESAHQAFEPTAVPQLLSAQNYSMMSLMKFQQSFRQIP